MKELRWKWVDHKGKRILRVDYRRLRSGEVLLLIKESIAVVLASPSPVRLLGNIDDAGVSPAVMKEMKKLGGTILRQKLEKTAVVGVTGVMGVFFDAYVAVAGKDTARKFEAEKEALDWLAE
jgi:hydrogenase maturation factor HypF (carbamoyltransferase family)